MAVLPFHDITPIWNDGWQVFMFSYLVVFDDLLIVSRTRAREKTSGERQKPGMGVFLGPSPTPIRREPVRN